jgi:putative oxidoreductase
MMIFAADKVRDGALLLARVLLSMLFVIFGWTKLTNFSATVGYFADLAVPLPGLATVIAVVMEFFVGVLIILGLLTRPLALMLAVYTLATALIGHPYWTIAGPAQLDAEINFYKNVGIIGGLVLLYVTGAGKYAVDRMLNMA